jgi:hypothetical protein
MCTRIVFNFLGVLNLFIRYIHIIYILFYSDEFSEKYTDHKSRFTRDDTGQCSKVGYYENEIMKRIAKKEIKLEDLGAQDVSLEIKVFILFRRVFYIK